MIGLLLSLFFLGAPMQANELAKTDCPPVIDGKMEAMWTECTEMSGSFAEITPDFGKITDESASMRMCYDKENFYIFIDAKQDPSTFVEVNAVRDKGWLQDQIGIIIDPMGNGAEEYFIIFGLAGNLMDMRKMRKASDVEDGTWDCEVEYAVRKYDEGYTVEAKIPFSNFKLSGKKEVKWGVNFYRRVFSTNSQSVYSALSAFNDDAEFDALIPVTMKDIGQKVKVDITPYGVYGAIVDSSIADYGNAGIDAKINMNSSSVLNFAFNPDYSQLEGDPLTFTVNNQYARYYSEYRPFFIEETNIFRTADRINYTRSTVNPYIAGKYTYKDPSNQIGIISAYDKTDPNVGNEEAVVNIGRYTRQIGGSNAGIMLMNKYFVESGIDNTVIMADGGWFPNPNLRFTGYVAGNYKIAADSTDEFEYLRDQSGYAYSGRVVFADQNWIWAVESEGVSGDFRNEMGYETYRDLNVVANYLAKRLFLNNSIVKYIEIGETSVFVYPWSGLSDYIENIGEQAQFTLAPEIRFRLFNGANIRAVFTNDNEIYNGYYFSSKYGYINLDSRITSYLRFDFYGRTGDQIDYNYSKLGWSDVFVYNIYYTPAGFLSLNTGCAYSYFKSDTIGNATSRSEIENQQFRWRGLTFDGGITYTPSNVLSMKLIGELQNIYYAEGYISENEEHEQNRTLFFVTEYKPSLGNVVYIGGRYPDKTIFFKFTTRFSV